MAKQIKATATTAANIRPALKALVEKFSKRVGKAQIDFALELANLQPLSDVESDHVKGSGLFGNKARVSECLMLAASPAHVLEGMPKTSFQGAVKYARIMALSGATHAMALKAAKDAKISLGDVKRQLGIEVTAHQRGPKARTTDASGATSNDSPVKGAAIAQAPASLDKLSGVALLQMALAKIRDEVKGSADSLHALDALEREANLLIKAGKFGRKAAV